MSEDTSEQELIIPGLNQGQQRVGQHGLILPDSLPIRTRQQEGEQIAHGLVSSTTLDQGRLSLPSHYQTEERGGITLVTDSRKGTFFNPEPTLEEIKTYGSPLTGKKEAVKRNPSESALARLNFPLFLRREVEKSGNITNEMESVLDSLEGLGKRDTRKSDHDHPQGHVLVREKHTKSKVDIGTKLGEQIQHTTPGPVERVVLVAAKLFEEDEFRRVDMSSSVVNTVSTLIAYYRTEGANPVVTAPEMPDATVALIQALDSVSRQPGTREAIYTLIDQIEVPSSLYEDLLVKMDRLGDLHHPLAFRLMLMQASANPDSPWLVEQKQRREHLLQSLSGSNQDLFDSFNALAYEARKLVCSDLPTQKSKGKVGIEIEFVTRRDAGDLMYQVPAGWEGDPEQSMDIESYNEFKKDEIQLEYDNIYALQLVEMNRYLRDTALYLGTTHIHLDKTRHPTKPSLGALYIEDRHGRGAIADRYQTWEIRSVRIPSESNALSPQNAQKRRYLNTFSPARMSDIVNLHIRAAAQSTPTPDFTPISVNQGVDEIDWKQLVFGHICSYVQDPEARLAALLVLQHDQSLRAYDPSAFIRSYTHKSLPTIVGYLEKENLDEDQLQLFGKLDGYLDYKTDSDRSMFTVVQDMDNAEEKYSRQQLEIILRGLNQGSEYAINQIIYSQFVSEKIKFQLVDILTENLIDNAETLVNLLKSYSFNPDVRDRIVLKIAKYLFEDSEEVINRREEMISKIQTSYDPDRFISSICRDMADFNDMEPYITNALISPGVNNQAKIILIEYAAFSPQLEQVLTNMLNDTKKEPQIKLAILRRLDDHQAWYSALKDEEISIQSAALQYFVRNGNYAIVSEAVSLDYPEDIRIAAIRNLAQDPIRNRGYLIKALDIADTAVKIIAVEALAHFSENRELLDRLAHEDPDYKVQLAAISAWSRHAGQAPDEESQSQGDNKELLPSEIEIINRNIRIINENLQTYDSNRWSRITNSYAAIAALGNRCLPYLKELALNSEGETGIVNEFFLGRYIDALAETEDLDLVLDVMGDEKVIHNTDGSAGGRVGKALIRLIHDIRQANSEDFRLSNAADKIRDLLDGYIAHEENIDMLLRALAATGTPTAASLIEHRQYSLIYGELTRYLQSEDNIPSYYLRREKIRTWQETLDNRYNR